MKTKLTNNVKFLKPFLKGLSPIVSLKDLKRIQGYRVTKGLIERQNAGITKYMSSRKYVISLKTQIYSKRKRKFVYETLEQILLDLSHELAHLLEWEHTSKHFKIQGKIMLHFAEKLKQLNIEDHSLDINRIRRLNESY